MYAPQFPESGVEGVFSGDTKKRNETDCGIPKAAGCENGGQGEGHLTALPLLNVLKIRDFKEDIPNNLETVTPPIISDYQERHQLDKGDVSTCNVERSDKDHNTTDKRDESLNKVEIEAISTARTLTNGRDRYTESECQPAESVTVHSRAVCHKKESESSTKRLREETSCIENLDVGLESSDSIHAFPKPFIYCRLVSRFPKLSFIFTLSGHLTLLLVTIGLILGGYDLFPVYFENLPLILHRDSTRSHALAWRNKMVYEDSIYRWAIGGSRSTKQMCEVGDILEVIYEADNVLTKDVLKTISKFENSIFQIPSYQDKYCRLTGYNECEKPVSLLRLFDGTYAYIDNLFSDAEFGHIPFVISKALEHEETRELAELFLGKSANITEQSAQSSITRSMFVLCLPLSKEDNLEDFMPTIMKHEVENSVSSFSSDSLSICYISGLMFNWDVLRQALTDMKLAIGSFLFIYVFMILQTASIWIASWGLFSIISSFFFTNLVYRFVLGYNYFGFFHIISIFIILGIGADDIFVFYDTWRLAGGNEWPSLSHRLSACCMKASKSTFVTSLTTCVAFLVSALSPLLAVSTFGIFSGILIIINYISVIVFFPTVICTHQYIIEYIDGRFPCLSHNLKCQCRCLGRKNIETEQIQKFSEQNRVVKFLKDRYFSLIRLRTTRVLVPLVFLSVSLYFIYAVTLLVPDTQQTKIYRDNTNYGKGFSKHNSAFLRNTENDYAKVFLVWGMHGRDISSCDFKSYEYCSGEQVWDQNFNISSPDAQIAMYRLCQRLDSLTDYEVDQLKIRRHVVTGKPEISCFMTDLERFLKEEEKIYKETGVNVDFSLPLTRHKLEPLLEMYPTLFVESLPEDFDHWLEIGITLWLTNRYTYRLTEDYIHYNHLLGTQYVDGMTKNIAGYPRSFYGSRLKYMAVEINTTLKLYATGYSEGEPVYRAWEQFIQEEVKEMPESLKGAFEMTNSLWHWIRVQEALVDSAITGIIVGLCLALPILVIMTMNVVIGVLATITISLVTVCVVGIIPLAGWRLGVLESLNLCMVVGLSVDYVVHLAEAYTMSKANGRMKRVQDMLESMGLSVVSGAMTSFIAAIFMLFAEIQFLYQFGIFVICTIGLSFMYSIVGFTVFLALCGPQGNTGSLLVIGRYLKEGTKNIWKKLIKSNHGLYQINDSS
ncbi:hypothetical protein ScPMuIL_014236 [Solemya velum]